MGWSEACSHPPPAPRCMATRQKNPALCITWGLQRLELVPTAGLEASDGLFP